LDQSGWRIFRLVDRGLAYRTGVVRGKPLIDTPLMVKVQAWQRLYLISICKLFQANQALGLIAKVIQILQFARGQQSNICTSGWVGLICICCCHQRSKQCQWDSLPLAIHWNADHWTVHALHKLTVVENRFQQRSLALASLCTTERTSRAPWFELCDVAAISAADSVRLAGCRGRESVQSATASAELQCRAFPQQSTLTRGLLRNRCLELLLAAVASNGQNSCAVRRWSKLLSFTASRTDRTQSDCRSVRYEPA